MTETIKAESTHVRTVALKNILLVTENPEPSAPIFSLAAEFNRLGVATRHGDVIWTSTPQWLQCARQHPVLVFVHYSHAENRYFEHQIFRAKVLGCLVVRWWVGSDVLWCRASPQSIRAANTLDKAVDLNIAVSPHLVTELAEIGITAEYVPSPCDLSAINTKPPAGLPSGVLTYLPAGRREFYGESVLIAAVEANPDLPFYVVNDDSHALQHYPNVTSLGWVDDMEPIWAKVGLLLRVTKHDGMPRMVLEALARSRYVVYSQHFAGCWYARSNDEVLTFLDHFKALSTFNEEGPRVARDISQNAGCQYLQKIVGRKRALTSLQRLRDRLAAIRYSV